MREPFRALNKKKRILGQKYQVDLKLGLEVPTLVATALLPAMQNWEEIYQKSPIQMTTFASGAMHPT